MFWTPQISPSSFLFLHGRPISGVERQLVRQRAERLASAEIAFDQPGQAERREPLLTEMRSRFRDVEQGPDGFIYFTTELRFGTGKPDGTIIRIEPAP